MVHAAYQISDKFNIGAREDPQVTLCLGPGIAMNGQALSCLIDGAGPCFIRCADRLLQSRSELKQMLKKLVAAGPIPADRVGVATDEVSTTSGEPAQILNHVGGPWGIRRQRWKCWQTTATPVVLYPVTSNSQSLNQAGFSLGSSNSQPPMLKKSRNWQGSWCYIIASAAIARAASFRCG